MAPPKQDEHRQLDRWAKFWPVAFVLTLITAGFLETLKPDGFTWQDLELAAGRIGEIDISEQQSTIRKGLWIDMAFIILYSAMLLLACRKFRGQYYTKAWAYLGITLGWASIMAGVFDVVENVGTFGYIDAWFDWENWPQLIAAAAWPKWVIVVAAAAYVLIGMWLWFARNVLAGVGRWVGGRRDAAGDGLGLLPVELQIDWGDEHNWSDDEAEWPDDDWSDDGGGEGGGRFETVDASTDRPHRPEPDGAQTPAPITVCSSGGGVRSAAFNLGALQAVDESSQVAVAYHVAVSGGGYIAGARAIVAANPPDGAPVPIDPPPFARDTPEERNFRNNSNYLAPSALRSLRGIGQILVGLAYSVIFIGAILLLLGRPWGALVSSNWLYPELRTNAGAVAVAATDLKDEAQDIIELVEVDEEETSSPPPLAADLDVAADDLLLAADGLEGELDQLALDLCESYDYCESDGQQPIIPRIRPEWVLATNDTIRDGQDVVVAARGLACDLPTTSRIIVVVCPVDEDTELDDATAIESGARGVVVQSDAVSREATGLLRQDVPISGGWWIVAFSFGVAVVLALAARTSLLENHTATEKVLRRLASLMLGVGVFLLFTIFVLPFIFTRGWEPVISGVAPLVDGRGDQLLTGALTTGAFVAAALRGVTAGKSSILANVVGLVLAPLVAIAALIRFAGAGAASGLAGNLGWLVGAAAVLALVMLVGDLNKWSLNPYYLERLSKVYAVKRAAGGVVVPADGPDEGPDLKLSRYTTTRTGGELVISAIANVNGEGATLAGLDAVPYVYSARRVGSRDLGFVTADEMEARLGKRWQNLITLPAAMAVSGAAFAPSMGKQTRPGLRAVLALTNLRTGLWLPNVSYLDPANPAGAPDRKWVARPKPTYLLKEIFGIHGEDDPYLYITDGGHWDNLGFEEALQLHRAPPPPGASFAQPPQTIMVIDAAGDAPDRFTTLGQALELAQVDGIDTGFDPTSLRGAPSNDENDDKPIISPRDHLVHQFEWGGALTTLVYCKALVTEGAPWNARAYQESNPTFPSQGTIDQFYDHDQFEAYRALGEHVATRALATLEEVGDLNARGFEMKNGRAVYTGP